MAQTPSALPTSSAGNQRELELVRAIAGGDRAALKELYLLYHRRLARFLLRVTSRQDVAEEVINDTMMTVWKGAGHFRGDSRVSTWIVGIAYRLALKNLRHVSRAASDLDSAESMAGPDLYSRNEDSEWIEFALRELPNEQRHALELAYVLGHSCEEIAGIMECSVNTVKTRLFHARRKMKLSLPRLAGVEHMP